MNPIYSVMILICILSMTTLSILTKCSVALTSKAKMWFVITFMGIAFGMTAEFYGHCLMPIQCPMNYISLLQ